MTEPTRSLERNTHPGHQNCSRSVNDIIASADVEPQPFEGSGSAGWLRIFDRHLLSKIGHVVRSLEKNLIGKWF